MSEHNHGTPHISPGPAPAGAPQYNRGLWYLTGGQVIQLFGDHALTVAISAYTYGMTGSTWAFALQQLVMFTPWVLFSSIAGPIVDRLDRRKVMIVADIVRGVLCLGYPLCRSLEPILLLNFVNSVCRVFATTARTAIVPSLCSKNVLLKVNGVRTSVFGAVDLTVPTLAGVVVAKAGAVKAFPFVTFAAVAGASFYTLIRQHVDSPPVTRARAGSDACAPRSVQTGGHEKSLQEAVTFVKGDKTLLGLILLYCVYVAGQQGVNAIFYPFVESVLHAGPEVFGLSVSLYFGSNLVAGLILARYGRRLSRISPTVLMAAPMVAWILHSLIRQVPVSLGMGLIEGLAMSILTTLLTTEVQSRAPGEMTGRVWGLAQTVASASEVSGIIAAGAIGERFGPAVAYMVAGMTGLAAVIMIAATTRILERRRTKGSILSASKS